MTNAVESQTNVLLKEYALAELGLTVLRESAQVTGDHLIELGRSLKSEAEATQISPAQLAALNHNAISKLISDTREALQKLEVLIARKNTLGL
jgi:hypothetical protein